MFGIVTLRNVQRSPLKHDLQTLMILIVPFNKGPTVPLTLHERDFHVVKQQSESLSQILDFLFNKPVLLLVLALRIKTYLCY